MPDDSGSSGDRSEDLRARSPSARLILDLLAYAAGCGGPAPRHPVWEHADGAGLDRAALEQVAIAGLAPLLHEAAGAATQTLPAVQRESLLAADLTARVRHGQLAQVAKEVAELCHHLQVPLTLLKGISISEQHYPAPHLRPMTDVDILVPATERARVQSALQGRGYLSLDGDWGHAAHGAPLLHQKHAVWVEIHGSLFPPSARLSSSALFAPSRLALRSVPHTFQGIPASRLDDDLQLVYIASTWIRDLSQHAIHPSFLVPLFDAAFLLRRAGERIDWERVTAWLDNEMAATSLYLMLAYLARHDLAGAASAVLPQLAAHQRLAGPIELRMLFGLLDRSLVAGAPTMIGPRARYLWDALLADRALPVKLAALPWRMIFPADIQDRYSARHLIRVARKLAAMRKGPHRY
ncbi:MAG: nucleotidyltransferase family protein [Burkholderiaceae bacterium]|jgi:hypothetical protein|nr:nucleotidyltransferase family protein [Burkholderiaceae bacterium]